LALALLSACALQRPQPIDWAARRADLAGWRDWDASGRIAVRSEHGGTQGDLAWAQRGEETRLRVNGPFGVGAYELRWNSSELTVIGKGGAFSRSYDGPESMNDFLAEQLGWPFPAASVRYWLLAVPDPVAPAAEEHFDEHGALSSIDQLGWSIGYEKFVLNGREWLPTRVTLASSKARVRLALDRWDLH
jgi:outer membrane lipoprotein LolB